MLNKSEVKKLAIDCGAELAGVARIEDFANDEYRFKLKSLQPEAKSVIVMGFSINRGALRGVEEGTNWGAVNAGSPTNPMVIPSVTYKFSRLFEQRYGYEAVCLTKLPPALLERDPEKPIENEVNFFEYAAYLAGIGVISKGKFFITKEFGIRQYFAAIITDASIEADTPMNEDFCGECTECIKSCPYGAISSDERIIQKISDNEISYNKIQIEKCFICKTGAISSQYLDDSDFNILNRGAKALNTETEPSRISAACGRACVACLEEKILKGKFVNKFRDR